MKCTKKINRVFKTKIIIHSTLIQLVLARGRKKFEQFASSLEGREQLTTTQYQYRYNDEKKIVELMCAEEQSSEFMSKEESTRREIFCSEPGSIALEFINRADKNGRYPIVTAAQNRDVKLFKTLYDLGVYVGVKNDDGSIALQSKDDLFDSLLKMVVKKELECSPISENPCNNPLQVKIAQFVPSENNENLREIINLMKNDPKQLKLKNKDGQTVLIIAAEKGHFNIVKVCHKLEADLDESDTKGETALYKASANGYARIVKYLLASEADVNKANNHGMTPLIKACLSENKEIVEELLKADEIDTSLQDNDGETALIAACWRGKKEIVNVLLQVDRIDTNIKNNEGETALMIACYRGEMDIIKGLLQVDGVDTSLTNNEGDTALMIGCYGEKKDVVQILLQVDGVNTSLKNKKGETALMIACRRGKEDFVELLLNVDGMNSSLQSDSGETPKEIAVNKGVSRYC